MDGLRVFLGDVKRHDHARNNFLGLLYVAIGRRVERPEGKLLCNGVTWRTLAGMLRKLRWDKDAVRELGLDPAELPPRDRERFWFLAIVRAHVDSPAAAEAGERLAEKLRGAGYVIGPGGATGSPT